MAVVIAGLEIEVGGEKRQEECRLECPRTQAVKSVRSEANVAVRGSVDGVDCLKMESYLLYSIPDERRS